MKTGNVIDQAFEAALQRLVDHAMKTMREELKGQGHVLTGSLINSMTSRVSEDREGLTAAVYLNQYFQYLERRLPPDKVPYSPGSGAKSSKVVEALKRYWKLRGLPPEEATRATFATLNKWKQEGRPTRSSFRYAKNGRRTGFLEQSIKQIQADAIEILSRGVVTEIEKALAKALRTAVRSSFAGT